MEQHKSLISTKADTLFALRSLIHKSTIEEMYILHVRDYQRDKLEVCHEIMDQFRGGGSWSEVLRRRRIRSSVPMQATIKVFWMWILPVSGRLLHAVDAVIASYRRDISNLAEEQVLIQCQALKCSLQRRGIHPGYPVTKPYYLINYDETGSTDSVTSGSAGRMMKVVRNVDENTLDTPWKDAFKAVRELEHIMDGLALDIEFAIDRDYQVILFQMRPLVASYKQAGNYDDHAFFELLEDAGSMYERHKNVITKEPMMMSDMAFWNPSEIIGSNPRPLDYSLYRALLPIGPGIRELRGSDSGSLRRSDAPGGK